MKNSRKNNYEEPKLDVVSELVDVLTTSGDIPFIPRDEDDNGWT